MKSFDVLNTAFGATTKVQATTPVQALMLVAGIAYARREQVVWDFCKVSLGSFVIYL